MPITEEQLNLLRTAFRPHFPIEDPAAFSGRELERTRVREAVSQPGLQVVVYGERGCGKTSLVNVATAGFAQVKVFCEKEADFARIMRDTALEIQKYDPERVIYDAAQNTIKVGGIVLPLGNLTGNNLLSILPNDKPFCVILDELDRVADKTAVELLAELTKNVATNRPNLTFVMVGVANTANDLLAGHASNFRNMLQVQLDRMEEDELKGILARGEEVLGLKFSEDAKNQILSLCDRMPYYLHLLATGAARAAFEAASPTVELDDLIRGAREAAYGADQQLRTTYDYAIISQRGTHIYQRIIWAMANLAPKANNLADITLEANNIALSEADNPVTPQAIGRALRQLASAERRSIVYQPMQGVYGFTNPLMKGFIKLVRYQQ
jgi:AAA ATPase domain